MGVILKPKSVQIGVDFPYVFGVSFERGFGTVLGVFGVTFWCQNDDQEEMGRFVEMLVLHKEIGVFKGCGLHFGCQDERKRKVGIRSGLKLGFVMIWGLFLNHFGSNFVQKSI